MPRSPHSLLAPLLLAAALLAGPASGQGFLGEGGDKEQPFDVTADSVEHDAQRGVYVARGNVRITQPDRVLSADWVGFSATSRQGLASGNVVVIQGEDVLRAEVLQFQIDTVKGVVFDGSLEGSKSRFLMKGDVIQKTGEDTYVFDKGRFTSCKCPEGEKEPWVLTAKKADLAVGGYGTARNTTFEVLGVPVLWLPWMIYPLKSDRATGFLFPVWNASSRNGFDVGLPFFWAVGERLNLTFTASYLTENGFLPSVEGKYVFGARSHGRFYGAWIDDQNIQPNDPSTPFSAQRWAVESIHDQYLPYDFRWVVDARFFSDNLYPFDFKEFTAFRKDRYIESQTFVERRFGPLDRYGFYGAVQWADDQQNPDNQDRDDFLLQRLPQLHGSGVPQRLDKVIPGLVGSFDVDYTNYWAKDQVSDPFNEARLVDDLFVDAGIDAIPDGAERDSDGRVFRPDGTVQLSDGQTLTDEEYVAQNPNATVQLKDGTVTTVAEVLATDPAALTDGSLDDFPPGPEGDRVFEEGELLNDRGGRVFLNPRLSYPMRLWDSVEVLPEIAYHGTLYGTKERGFSSRNLFTVQLDVRTRLRRELPLPFGMGDVLHILEPRMQYTGVTNANQSDNPLFTPQTTPLQQRLRELALFGVSRDYADRIEDANAFTFGFGNRFYVARKEAEGNRLFADVDVALQYDFSNGGFTGFYIDGSAWPAERIRSRFNVGYDFNAGEVSEALLATSWSHEEGHDLGIAYRYVAEAPRFFEAFTLRQRALQGLRAGRHEDQPDLPVRALGGHAELGAHLPDAVLLRGVVLPRQPGGRRVRVEVRVLGGPGAGLRRADARDRLRLPLPPDRPRGRHGPAVPVLGPPRPWRSLRRRGTLTPRGLRCSAPARTSSRSLPSAATWCPSSARSPRTSTRPCRCSGASTTGAPRSCSSRCRAARSGRAGASWAAARGRCSRRGTARPCSSSAGAERRFRIAGDPLLWLRERLAALRPALPAGPPLPRFAGGAVGAVAWDWVRFVERVPDANPDELGFPDVWFVLPETVVAYDNVRHVALVIREVELRPGEDPRARWREESAALEATVARLRAPLPFEPRARGARADVRRDEPHARRLSRDGEAREGVHRGGRHLPGGAVPARAAAAPGGSVPDLPAAPPHQPEPVPVLPARGAGAHPDRLLAGDPGARRGRADRPAADRRHAAARRDAPRTTAPSRRSCWPTRRSAPST